jgi:hypothetical protein
MGSAPEIRGTEEVDIDERLSSYKLRLLARRVGAGISGVTASYWGGTRMTTFDDRENAFENKFAHDAQLQFKAEARRNRLLGLWAAEIMGKSIEEAAEYAKEVVKADFEEAGDEDVYRKVSGDLGEHRSETEIRTKMAELMVEAKKQILSES